MRIIVLYFRNHSMGLFLLDNLKTRTTQPIQIPCEFIFRQLPSTLENLVGNAFSDVLQEEDLADLFNNDDSIILLILFSNNSIEKYTLHR